jgi:hypothetical protein
MSKCSVDLLLKVCGFWADVRVSIANRVDQLTEIEKPLASTKNVTKGTNFGVTYC